MTLSLQSVVRRGRHWAEGKQRLRTRWRLHDAMFRQAYLIVWFFYVASAYFLYDGARAFSHLVDTEESLALLWPVSWLPSVGLDRGGKIVAHLGLTAAILGLLWWRFLAVRMLVSVALLLFAAFSNSYGAINHNHHEWFWISVCFWFLPTARSEEIAATRVKRMEFLTAFSLAPLLILFFYTLSGIYKCYYGFVALAFDQIGGFSPHAMGITIAMRAFQTGSQPMWAEFAVGYPYLSWPFYLGLYFAEIVSIFVFFRPQLHRLWGVVLIMFHFGTLLFMDIVFAKHVLINGMLFVMSPFAMGQWNYSKQLASVPLLGAVYSLLARRERHSPRTVAAPGSVEHS